MTIRGSVHKRPNGTFEAVIDAGRQPARRCSANKRHKLWVNDDPRAKTCPRCGAELEEAKDERRQWRRTFRTKGEAQSEVNTRVGALDRGIDPFPKDVSVRDYIARYMEHAKTQVRAKTWHRYQELLDLHALPEIGDLPLARVKPAHVQMLLDKVTRKGRSPRTVIQLRAVLGKAFHQALRWELIPTNPAAATEPPKAVRPELDVPDGADLWALVEAARGSVWEIPMLLAVTTGARRGEALAIRWADVDLDTGRVRIVRTLQHGEERGSLVYLDPKTPRARRQVTLPPIAIELLRRHRAEQATRRLALGAGWDDGDLVCDRGDGSPLRPDGFTAVFKRYAALAGLPATMRLHDVRHGVATALLSKGGHPAIASAVLGHASPGFTMATYQHVVESMTDTAATALGDALGGAR